MEHVCDITNCEKEGLHKTYTSQPILFENEENSRTWIWRCDAHIYGPTEYNLSWFPPPPGLKQEKI